MPFNGHGIQYDSFLYHRNIQPNWFFGQTINSFFAGFITHRSHNENIPAGRHIGQGIKTASIGRTPTRIACWLSILNVLKQDNRSCDPFTRNRIGNNSGDGCTVIMLLYFFTSKNNLIAPPNPIKRISTQYRTESFIKSALAAKGRGFFAFNVPIEIDNGF